MTSGNAELLTPAALPTSTEFAQVPPFFLTATFILSVPSTYARYIVLALSASTYGSMRARVVLSGTTSTFHGPTLLSPLVASPTLSLPAQPLLGTMAVPSGRTLTWPCSPTQPVTGPALA